MKAGRYGRYGGQYIPETLMNAVQELDQAYEHYKNDPEFQKELDDLYKNYAGRPSLLYYAEKMTKDLGGAKIYLKREDLNHTGSHKINNVLGQALLAKKMGKTRIIAETGAGQHGVAAATAAALMGMECEIYMGKEDTERQALNVFRMELLGAKVHPVTSGTMTLKDAGTPVKAPADALVKTVGSNEELGNYVTLDLGNGYEAVCGQLEEPALSEGDFVEAGSVIGTLAEPTKYYVVEGTSLYFEVTKDGAPIDPLELMQ